MKRLLIILLFAPLLVACSQQEELEMESVVSYATVENPNQSINFYLNRDDSTRLWVVDNEIKYYRPKNDQRVLVDYTVLTTKPRGSSYQHDVKINDVYEILTKNIFYISPATADSIGDDLIAISGIWIANDFLNIEFLYPGYSKIHYVNLVRDTTQTYTDGKIHLEFRHNANGDYPTFNISGIVAFNLKELRKVGSNSVDLVIHTNEYNSVSSEKYYNFTYKYGTTSQAAPKRTYVMPERKAQVK